MAPVTLQVRVTGSEPFEAEIEDDETVESLAVIIYSIHPSLGEELRIIHKGRLLRPEQVLSEVGVKSGDAIAVARKAAAAPNASPPVVEQASEQPEEQVALASSQDPSGVGAITDAMTGGADHQEEVPADAAAVAKEAQEEAVTSVSVADITVDVSAATASGDQAEAKADVAADAPIADASPIAESSEEAKASSAEADQAASTRVPAVNVDLSTAEGLLAYARMLEMDNDEAPPAHVVAAAARVASSRISALEEVINNFSQALQMVNMVSAHSLRSVGAGGESQGSDDPTRGLSSPKAREEEPSKSFLLKKGDSDVQEKYKASLERTVSGSSTSGGVLSDSKTLTKEEMQQAREARLAVLEAKQDEKKKEQEEADEKTKAREAMFNRQFVGPSKPLGKH